jgi:chorismate mutase-like protein
VTLGPELDALRAEIDSIDRDLLNLLAKRFAVVLRVGEVKRAHGTEVYDPERERRVIERLTSEVPAPLDRETVRRIFERIIDEARRLEQHHVAG